MGRNCWMSSPNLLLILQNVFALLILISFVKCDPPLDLASAIFNSNVSSLSRNLDTDNCSPVERITNGNIQVKLYMGQTAAFVTCDKNFTLIGKSIIFTKCVDGIWTLNFDEVFPKCEKKCPPPPYLEHGKIRLEMKMEDAASPTGTYLEGTAVEYVCNEGYTLEPSLSSFRFCEKGMWTGDDTFCVPAQETNCPRPPAIENGYMQPSFPIEYSPISVGDEVLYKCLHGYNLVGSEKIKCTDNGIWSPEAPTCHKVDDFNLRNLEPKISTLDRASSDSVVFQPRTGRKNIQAGTLLDEHVFYSRDNYCPSEVASYTSKDASFTSASRGYQPFSTPFQSNEKKCSGNMDPWRHLVVNPPDDSALGLRISCSRTAPESSSTPTTPLKMAAAVVAESYGTQNSRPRPSSPEKQQVIDSGRESLYSLNIVHPLIQILRNCN